MATTTLTDEHAPAPARRGAGLRARSRRLVVAALTAEVVLAGLLASWSLGRNSIWVDEAYTWSTVSRSWSSFVHLVVHKEGGGLLYSLLMFGWVRLGDGAAWMRIPSAVFAVAAVPMLFLAVRRLSGERSALVAGLLLALNGVVVHYAQEARTYSLMVLVATVSFFFFVRVVDELGHRRASVVGWVVSSALLVYTIPLAAAVVVAEIASLAFLAPRTVPWRAVRSGTVAIALLSAPMVVLQLAQSAAGRVDRYLEGGRTPTAVVKVVLGLSGGGGPALIFGYTVVVVVAAVVAVRTWRAQGRSQDAWRVAVPFLWLVVPCVVVVGASYVTPNFASRYLLMAVPGLAAVAAVGVMCALGTRRAAFVLLVLVALASLGLVQYYGSRKDDFRDATRYVLTHARPGDGVAFIGDEGRIAFEYFTRDGQARRAGLVPAYPSAPWGHFGTGDERVAVPTRPETAQLAHGNARLWVFRYGDDPATGARLRQLGRSMIERRWRFQDTIELYLFSARQESNGLATP